MPMILTGVGSRQTPPIILALMNKIAMSFSQKGLILRSGGALGADSAFEDYWNGTKEIYLPWNGYNGKKGIVPAIDSRHKALASGAHPAWDRCSEGAKKMHSRNVCQVLGQDLNTPANLLVCWTKDGGPTGGTGVAIRLAMQHDIPVYNLYNSDAIRELRALFKTI